MQNISKKTESLPGGVWQLLRQLGWNIRTARLRRRMPLRELAERTGLSAPTLIRVEAGNPGTSIAAYATVLWVLGLADALDQVAHPDSDKLGLALETARTPERARATTRLSDDF